MSNEKEKELGDRAEFGYIWVYCEVEVKYWEI